MLAMRLATSFSLEELIHANNFNKLFARQPVKMNIEKLVLLIALKSVQQIVSVSIHFLLKRGEHKFN
jgi:hypothetical protein